MSIFSDRSKQAYEDAAKSVESGTHNSAQLEMVKKLAKQAGSEGAACRSAIRKHEERTRSSGGFW